MNSKSLYLEPQEITITKSELIDDINIWAERISLHETTGLAALGCNVERTDNLTVVTAQDPQRKDIPFYNRYMDIKLSPEELQCLINSNNTHMSFIVNSQTEPSCAAQLLEASDYENTISSIVLVGNITDRKINSDKNIRILRINLGSSLVNESYILFSNFFKKPLETREACKRRFMETVDKGPHLIGYYKDEPVSMIGSVVLGDTCSVYCGIVKSDLRTSRMLDILIGELRRSLVEQQVTYLYMKTRNRAVVAYAQKFEGCQFLHTEKVYENSNKKVLILEAGGACAISAIKLLNKIRNINTLAVDMNKYAAGLFLADEAYTVPSALENNFINSMQTLIQKHDIDLILPTFEFGLEKLSKIRGPFITDFKSAINCKDKYNFSRLCKKRNLPHPRTFLLNEITSNIKHPIYIKPRRGSGTRKNFVSKSFDQTKHIKNLITDEDEFIAQEFLSGNHWNVDVLVESSKVIGAICRMDIQQRAGNCMIVKVTDYLPLIDFAKQVQKSLKINSVFNLEVFEPKKGLFVINEINVRFGGGIIFGAMAGFDIVSYIATSNKKYLGEIRTCYFSRYYEEVEVYPHSFIK